MDRRSRAKVHEGVVVGDGSLAGLGLGLWWLPRLSSRTGTGSGTGGTGSSLWLWLGRCRSPGSCGVRTCWPTLRCRSCGSRSRRPHRRSAAGRKFIVELGQIDQFEHDDGNAGEIVIMRGNTAPIDGRSDLVQRLAQGPRHAAGRGLGRRAAAVGRSAVPGRRTKDLGQFHERNFLHGQPSIFILDVPPAVLRRRPLRHLVIYANSPLVPVGSGGVDAGESVAVGLDFSQAYFLKGRKFKGVVGAVLSFRVGDLVQNGHFGWCVAVHAVVCFSWGGWDGMEWNGVELQGLLLPVRR